MNSEVTLEQLRELGRKVTASLEAGHFGTATVEECRYNEAVHCYVRQLLTTPPASGEVVGVPREPTMGRGSMMDAGVAAARSHKEAKDIDPTFGMVRAIYAAMLSAAPKQAMGWRPIESAPRDGTLVLLGREPNEDGDNAISAPGRWDDALDDGVDYMGHDGGFNDCDFQLFSPGRSFGHEKYRYAPNQPTLWQPLPSPPEKAGG